MGFFLYSKNNTWATIIYTAFFYILFLWSHLCGTSRQLRVFLFIVSIQFDFDHLLDPWVYDLDWHWNNRPFLWILICLEDTGYGGWQHTTQLSTPWIAQCNLKSQNYYFVNHAVMLSYTSQTFFFFDNRIN